MAHGCTGKGNDQVRFEASIMMLDPSLEIIAPVREWDLKTRPQEMDWAAAHGVEVPTTKKSPYSIDDNLWGRAIECGVLEDPWNEPPADIYAMTTDPEKAPDTPTVVEISFKDGVPCAIDGKEMSYLDIILEMNKISGANGFGRLDMVENRLVGVKSRECYEAPGALAIIKAHKALEDICLERDVLHYKLHVEHEWADQVYNGKWYAPLKAGLDAFPRNDAGQRHGHGAPVLLQGRLHGHGTQERLLALYQGASPPTTRATPSTTNLRRASSTSTASSERSGQRSTAGKGGFAGLPTSETSRRRALTLTRPASFNIVQVEQGRSERCLQKRTTQGRSQKGALLVMINASRGSAGVLKSRNVGFGVRQPSQSEFRSEARTV